MVQVHQWASVFTLLILLAAPLPVCRAQQQNQWTQKSPASSPPARYAHAMAYDAARSQVVLFGGAAGAGEYYGDTWVWDGTTWTQKLPPNNPPARVGHAMAYDAARGQVVLFGGSTSVAFFNDTWVWDGTTWMQKFPTVSPPARNNGQFLAYDEARGQVVLFGGTTLVPYTNADDTWVWDGVTWTQKFPSSSPPGRSTHAMAYDVARREVVLFGGSGSATSVVNLADTWVWDGNIWTQRFPATIPPIPRWNYTLA